MSVVLKTELPHLAGGGARQICSGKAKQLQHGENNNRLDHRAQTGSELPQIPIATCPVDRKNQIQSSGETISDLPLVTDSP
jgi:hypothetical protein